MSRRLPAQTLDRINLGKANEKAALASTSLSKALHPTNSSGAASWSDSGWTGHLPGVNVCNCMCDQGIPGLSVKFPSINKEYFKTFCLKVDG